MNRPVRVVLIDLDGVIRRWDPEIIAITGVITDEKWRRREIARVLVAAHGANAAGAVDEWSVSAGEVAWDVVDLVRGQRGRRSVALISNARRTWRAT